MSRLVTTLCLFLSLLALPLAAQVVPSSYTPLGICPLYAATTPANTTVFLQVREKCNIPVTANVVTLIAATTSSIGNGTLHVWEAGIFQPEIPSMLYRTAPGGDSQTLQVRLCYPLAECGFFDEDENYHGIDLYARLTASTYLTLSAVSYFEPLP